MKKIISILLFAIAYSQLAAQAVKKDYLSYNWVKYFYSKQWNSYGQEVEKQKQEAEKLNAEGFKLYKSKKDADAIKKYEAAIDLFPSGEIYYNYANSLSNIKRLEDSIKAYEIALKLETPRPELALYNIACSYSRLDKADNAYKYLASAVQRGYNAFEYIKKDPDMANLRKQSDWEAKLKAIKANANYDESSLAGKITEEGPRQPEYFYLCKSGIALTVGGDQINCEGKGFDRGKWKLVNGDVKVTFTESCNPEYVATAAEKKKAETEPVYEGMCPVGKPKFTACKKIDSKDYYGNRNFAREDVRSMLVPTTDTSAGPAAMPLIFSKFKNSEEPKQCDPNFKVKELKDFKVE